MQHRQWLQDRPARLPSCSWWHRECAQIPKGRYPHRQQPIDGFGVLPGNHYPSTQTVRASSETFQTGTGIAKEHGNSPGIATKTARKTAIASGMYTSVFSDATQTLGRLTPVSWTHPASFREPTKACRGLAKGVKERQKSFQERVITAHNVPQGRSRSGIATPTGTFADNNSNKT